MFGHITDLPRLFNFNDAVEHYKNTKGVRGRTHIKPLKNSRRSPDEYKICAVNNEAGEIVAVQCWLYNTPVLVYWKDRLVVNSYNSRTTNAFIDSIAPHWLRTQMRNNTQVIYIGQEGQFVGNGHQITIPVNSAYQPIAGQVEAPKLHAITLNKTRAAQARKQCKDVVSLATTTSKIDGYWLALKDGTDIAPDEETAWLRGLLKNGNYWVSPSGYYYSGFSSRAHNAQQGLLPALKRFLYRAQYRQDACYDSTPAPYGTIPKEYEVCDEAA